MLQETMSEQFWTFCIKRLKVLCFTLSSKVQMEDIVLRWPMMRKVTLETLVTLFSLKHRCS